jgi:steroid 5-alpha reductase family enzyme
MAGLPYVQLAYAWLGCSALFIALWWRQCRTANANAVDVGWAAAIGLLALAFALLGTASVPMRVIVAVLPVAWAVRLAGHIYRRARHSAEDSRYRYLRTHWSSHTQAKFFVFYQVQALTVLVFSFQFFMLANLPGSLGAWQAVPAVSLWLIALLGEDLADRQLSVWRSQPAHAHRTCRTGLWRYSRHPNYFFQWLTWVAYALMALAAPWGWIGLLAPLLILFLILFVTGIPPSEEQAVKSRGEDYRRYQRETSAFVPWFPKGAAR